MTEIELYDRKEACWASYVKARPKFPQSFFDRFYEYHQSKGGQFAAVNDIGAGVGFLSKELAKQFSLVVVTEPASETIATAESLLSQEPGQFRFCNSIGEDETQLPNSMDAVFACNCLHWMNVNRFVETAARQLKPGGTFFACLAAFPSFDDPLAQQTWIETMDGTIKPFMARIGEARVKSVLTIQDNACNMVDVSSRFWEHGAVRLELNCTRNPSAFEQSPWTTRQLNVPRISHVTERDNVEQTTDSDWAFETKVEDIRALVYSFPFEPEERVLSPFIERFERLAKSSGGTLKGRWPVSILMATRSSNTAAPECE